MVLDPNGHEFKKIIDQFKSQMIGTPIQLQDGVMAVCFSENPLELLNKTQYHEVKLSPKKLSPEHEQKIKELSPKTKTMPTSTISLTSNQLFVDEVNSGRDAFDWFSSVDVFRMDLIDDKPINLLFI